MEDVLKNEGRSKGGRTSLYSDALAEKIVGLIAEGYSERQIETMDGMPTRRTMHRWRIERMEFCLVPIFWGNSRKSRGVRPQRPHPQLVRS